MANVDFENSPETRQERREHKLFKKKERIAESGKGLAKIFHDAVVKRMKGKS
jgi:hypothetical protein